MADDSESIEKTIESGFIALLAVAVQIREGRKGTVSNLEILEAKTFLSQLHRKVAG